MFPGSGDWTVLKTFHRRGGCIFKVSSTQLKQIVAAKVYHPGLAGRESSEIMRQALEFYHARSSSSPRLTVPAPYGVVESLNLIVMEWIHTPTLHERLRRSRFSKSKRQGQIQMAAQWLLWFHRQAEISHRPHDSAATLHEYKRLIRSILAMQPNFLARETELQNHLKFWKKITAEQGDFQVAHAVVHHDFTPSNLFMSETCVTGFDLLAQVQRPITYDICRFLTYLSNSRIRPVPAADLRSCGCAKADFQSFMAVYGAEMREIPARTFLYLQYSEVLRRWLSVARQHAKGRRLRRQIQILQLKRMARHIAAGLRNA
jgi:hypothetical protein